MDISTPFFVFFYPQLVENGRGSTLSRGMTYQSDWKDLNKVTEYFVGAGLN
jgi:hypothetical protein